MTPLFKKLNWKPGQAVVLLNAPEAFAAERDAQAAAGCAFTSAVQAPVDFALAFVQQQAELDAAAAALTAAARGDAVLWFAYPKQSSKRYRCDFHRDTGFDGLRAAGWDSVRMVAIDADWSALRVRRVAHIQRRSPTA